MKLKPKFKLWLEVDGKPVIGEGRADLLMEIYETGSLSAAARNLRISYRHAHEMLSELNERCGMGIIATEVGGASGGGTRLTAKGRKLVESYQAMKNELENWLENRSS
ncbi:MAG: LysR family transcriptional regulator [Thermoplasmata archaeon]|nr:LysR family transcriptional regulator [Thermoplasmata archaeon]